MVDFWYYDSCHLFEEWEQQLIEEDEHNWEILERDEARCWSEEKGK